MPSPTYSVGSEEFDRYRVWALYYSYLTSLGSRRGNPYAVSGTEFSGILKSFHEKIRDKIIYENYIFKVPYQLGSFFIHKYKRKLYYDEDGRIDPVKSGLSWHWGRFMALTTEERRDPEKIRTCYCYNTHSKGYSFKLRWAKKGKKRSNAKNLPIFGFKMNIHFKNQAKDAFYNLYPKGEVDYFDITYRNRK